MAKTKIQTKTNKKQSRPPALQTEPATPEKQEGPRQATRPPEVMTAPEHGAGAADRARMMTHMQQSVGNTRVNRMVGGSVQTKPVVGAAGDTDEQEADRASSTVMRMPQPEESWRIGGEDKKKQPAQQAVVQRQAQSNAVVQRQPAPAPAPAAAPALATSPMDPIVSASLLDTLDRFQNIPIDVPGVERLPPGVYGPPAPLTVRVVVHAQYFINTPTARAHYAAARRSARFGSIIRALEAGGGMSLLEGSTRRRTSGRAVELGKATPEDIKLFVEEALSQGVIRDYAIRNRDITRSQQLTDLDPAALQAVIQRWMEQTGVGVDCSGFVQQAAIRAREAERATVAALNAVGGMFGAPAMPLPPEISPVERSAASFAGGPRVRVPTDLRPGDAWVVTGGGHIRIVTGVREASLPGSATTIEFDTAESSGGSTDPSPGPVARTWRTRNLTTFHPITSTDPTAHSRGGTFHRIR